MVSAWAGPSTRPQAAPAESVADFTPRPSSARPTTPDGGAGVGVSVTSDDAGFKVTTHFRLRIRCVTVGCPEPVGGSKRK